MALTDRIFPWLAHARVLASAPSYADQEVAELRCDALGRLIVTTEDEAAIAWTETTATGHTAVARPSAGIVGGIYAASLTDDNLFFQLFNLASGTPAPGAAPRHVFPLIAGALVSVEPLSGLAFELGCVWAVSTTAATYTAASGTKAHVIAKHRSAS